MANKDGSGRLSKGKNCDVKAKADRIGSGKGQGKRIGRGRGLRSRR